VDEQLTIILHSTQKNLWLEPLASGNVLETDACAGSRGPAAVGHEDVAAVFQDRADHLLDDVRHR